MIKLTTRDMKELLLNVSQIQSVRDWSRGVGADIVMVGGRHHEVQETAEQVQQRIEALRDA